MNDSMILWWSRFMWGRVWVKFGLKKCICARTAAIIFWRNAHQEYEKNSTKMAQQRSRQVSIYSVDLCLHLHVCVFLVPYRRKRHCRCSLYVCMHIAVSFLSIPSNHGVPSWLGETNIMYPLLVIHWIDATTCAHMLCFMACVYFNLALFFAGVATELALLLQMTFNWRPSPVLSEVQEKNQQKIESVKVVKMFIIKMAKSQK